MNLEKNQYQYRSLMDGGFLPNEEGPVLKPLEKKSADNPEQKKKILVKTGHVLVVDDDPIVLNMVSTLFSRFGCRVHSACDSGEALIEFEQIPAELVVTDFELPVMNGWKLGMHFKEINPATKVVIMTGCSPESLAEYIGNGWIDGWLFKPFRLSEMQTILEQIGLPHLLG